MSAHSRKRTSRTARSARSDRFRRALAAESPIRVGVLVTEEAFTTMTRLRTFKHRHYGSYLRHLDRLLRETRAAGRPVRAAVFDIDAYTLFVTGRGLDPDSAEVRSSFLDALPQDAFTTYTGQSVRCLLADVQQAADNRAALETAAELLAAAGTCRCGKPYRDCARERGVDRFMNLLDAGGAGQQTLVCSLTGSLPHRAVGHVIVHSHPDGTYEVDDNDAMRFVDLLAAAELLPAVGVTLRTTHAYGNHTVQGWSMRQGRPTPMPASSMRNAWLCDPATGDFRHANPAVSFADAAALPAVPSGHGPAQPGDARPGLTLPDRDLLRAARARLGGHESDEAGRVLLQSCAAWIHDLLTEQGEQPNPAVAIKLITDDAGDLLPVGYFAPDGTEHPITGPDAWELEMARLFWPLGTRNRQGWAPLCTRLGPEAVPEGGRAAYRLDLAFIFALPLPQAAQS